MVIGRLQGKEGQASNVISLLREPYEVKCDTDYFGEKNITTVKAPESLCHEISSETVDPKKWDELLCTIDASLIVYQSLYYQAGINKHKV